MKFNWNYLEENVHFVHLPLNGSWGILINEEYSCIAFLNIQGDITKRKIIIKDNLSVEIFLNPVLGSNQRSLQVLKMLGKLFTL